MRVSWFGRIVGWFGRPVTFGGEEEPMTFATYAPRCVVHDDRIGAHKTQGPNILLVVHTSEGGETATSAEAICSLMAQPGDRPNSSGGMYGASYHAVADTDCVRPAVDDDWVAYSAAGANHNGVHICIPGRASQTREQWVDTNSRPQIRRVAEWCADKHLELGIPIRKLTVDQVKAGESGICSHLDVSLAFKKSTHTDPGVNFPWDVLLADIAALLGGQPDPGLIAWREGGDVLYTPDHKFRLVDTRKGTGAPQGRVAAGTPLRVAIPAVAGVQGKTAIVNVTVVDATAPGFAQVDGAQFGDNSDVNYGADPVPRPCGTIAPIAADGTIGVLLYGGAAHVLVDLMGVVA